MGWIVPVGVKRIIDPETKRVYLPGVVYSDNDVREGIRFINMASTNADVTPPQTHTPPDNDDCTAC